MRPIIEYHGPLFQLLHQLVAGFGADNTLVLWRAGAVSWLLLLGRLALSNRLPAVFTTLLLAGIGLLRLPGLGLAELNVDESQWIASAATLVRHPRFWQSVDGTTSGPLNVWPPALLYYLGLSLDYTTLRLWGLLTCTVPTAWLLLATCRRAFGERTARLTSLAVGASLALTTDSDGVAFNSEQLPMVLMALAGYILSRLFIADKSRPSPGWLLVLGFILGSLPFTKLQAAPTGLVLAAWVVAGLLTGPYKAVPDRFRWLTGFVAGGLLPTLLIGLYLLATGLLPYAFRSYLLTNLGYAQAGSWGAGRISWADRLLVRLPQIYGTMSTTNWFWRLAVLLILAMAMASLFRFAGRPPGSKRWFAASVCAVTLYATLQPGNAFAHYQWLSFVPVSWLIAALLKGFLPGYTDRIKPGASTRAGSARGWYLVIVSGYLLLSVPYPAWLALSRPNPGIAQLATGGIATPTQAIAASIRQYAQPNQTMVVWGWLNSLHVETGLLLGSRFIPLYFPVVPGPEQPYFLDVYRQDLVANQPEIIVDAAAVRSIGDYRPYPIRRYPAIQAVLDSQYDRVATVDGARIYARRNRGAGSVDAIQNFGHVQHPQR